MKKNNKKRNVVTDNGIPEVMRDQAQNSYEQAFLRMDIEQKRGSKSIYLSPEYHERLTRIVQIIGNDKIPLFAYLNKILEHHFNVYEDAITKEFKEKYKGLF